jgi:hypothetical protein
MKSHKRQYPDLELFSSHRLHQKTLIENEINMHVNSLHVVSFFVKLKKFPGKTTKIPTGLTTRLGESGLVK